MVENLSGQMKLVPRTNLVIKGMVDRDSHSYEGKALSIVFGTNPHTQFQRERTTLDTLRKNLKHFSFNVIRAQLSARRPHCRLLLRLRHNPRRRRKARAPLDRLRPGPLRHPHHTQAPARHRWLQALRDPEPREVRAAVLAGCHLWRARQKHHRTGPVRIPGLHPQALRGAAAGGAGAPAR